MAKKHFNHLYRVLDQDYQDMKKLIEKIQDQLQESEALINPTFQEELETTIKPIKNIGEIINSINSILEKDKYLLDLQFKEIEENYKESLQDYNDAISSDIRNESLIEQLEIIKNQYEDNYKILYYCKYLLDKPNREIKNRWYKKLYLTSKKNSKYDLSCLEDYGVKLHNENEIALKALEEFLG